MEIKYEISQKMNVKDAAAHKGSSKKKNHKNYSNAPKHKENIIRKLHELYQDNFDLALIASVAHTCQWDIHKATDVLSILSARKDSKRHKPHDVMKTKAKSLPGTLKMDKTGIGKSFESVSSAHHNSTNSLSSGQVWQRHYKSKPQSPGLLTMIPPHSKEIKLKTSSSTKYPQKCMDPDVKKASITVKKIQKFVQNGVKVMILMRGVPGSGKSHLAQVVVRLVTANDLSQHILSTDDYFIMLGRGNYAYDFNQLPQAHNWNQKRVSESLKRGINPIVVDNTNTQAWEMQPYVVMAVEHGYVVEVLEPVTEWRNKEGELAKRNIHSVPREKIRQIMERYEVGWTGEKLLQSFGLKYKSEGGSAGVVQEVKHSTNALLAQHREHAAISLPEKPKRKKNGTKKSNHDIPDREITEDKEKQLEELNKLFAEYGKTMDPVSKQKVLESGVPILEVVSRMRKLQGNILPLPKPNTSSMSSQEMKAFSNEIKHVPSYSSLLRDPLSEPDPISSSNASEASECETDTDAELPKRKGVKCYFHGAFPYFVDGEDMLEGDDDNDGDDDDDDDDYDDDERKSEGPCVEEAPKSHVSCSQNVPSLIDFEAVATPTSFSQDDLSLLNFDGTDELESKKSSSSSEEQETQMLSLHKSLRGALLETDRRIHEGPSDSVLGNLSESSNNLIIDRSTGVDVSQSLLNVLGRRYDNIENSSKLKNECDAIGSGTSINESLLQMLVKKYSMDEVETSDETENGNFSKSEKLSGGTFECVKSPDLEEVPLPGIPPEDNGARYKCKQVDVSETASARKYTDSTCEKLESIPTPSSCDNLLDHVFLEKSNTDDLPKDQRSKGAIRKTGLNTRDKSPDELLRSIDLSWSSVPFTSSWDDVSEKQIEREDQNMPKPQRKLVSKSDSSTNTHHSDFDLWRKNEGVIKLNAHNRNINQNLREPAVPVVRKSEVLMLDKSSMTLDLDETEAVGKENGVETLSGMFPDIAREHLIDILDKCKGNILWAIEVLLETPQNLAAIPAGGSNEENPPTYDEAKALEDADYISLQNMVISDGKKTIKRRKDKKSSNSELSQMLKRQIEESIHINEDFYGDKTLFLKKLRHGEITLDEQPVSLTATSEDTPELEKHQLVESIESEDEEEETIPMKLDPEFFKMFTQQFKAPDGTAEDIATDLFCPVINVPMSLAQQIYDCWIENVNKQLEDMQAAYDKFVLDDELLAKAFQEQEFEYHQPDLREIMDMELAMLLYKQNQAHLHENFRETMATKLSKQLLFEAYPNMDKKMLLDLFESEGLSFQKTVDILSAQENQSPITVVAPEFLATHGKQLFEQVKSEIPKKNFEKIKKPIIVVKSKRNKKEEASYGKSVLLVNPVEYRQRTTQLHQQRNECSRLAQEAFRKKSYSVASYFSHIASLYKDRIKEISKEPFPTTLFDDKIDKEIKEIDLHFLLVSEALQILDLFLDHHIKELRKGIVSSTSLHLITGRGQHSTKGKSKIKPAVIKRLEHRHLSFTHVNPGMLRVTVHKNNLLSAEM